jgi:hypothetical protein
MALYKVNYYFIGPILFVRGSFFSCPLSVLGLVQMTGFSTPLTLTLTSPCGSSSMTSKN